MSKNLLITELKRIGIVQKQKVNLSHAGKSNIYYNVKKAYGDPIIRQIILDEFWNLIQKDAAKHEKDLTVIAGMGCGGITPASDLSLNYGRKLTILRNEPKQYGLEKQIEAYEPTNDDLIAIVDDVTTTGETLQNATDILQATGATVLGCYVLVKRGKAKLSVPLRYVLTPKDLV